MLAVTGYEKFMKDIETGEWVQAIEVANVKSEAQSSVPGESEYDGSIMDRPRTRLGSISAMDDRTIILVDEPEVVVEKKLQVFTGSMMDRGRYATRFS